MLPPPPYAAVAGCPAKSIRYRFEHETSGRLQPYKGWHLPEDDLRRLAATFNEPEKSFRPRGESRD